MQLPCYRCDVLHLPSLLPFPPSQIPSVSERLQQFLLGMVEDSSELHSSLQHVTKSSKKHTEEAEQELIDRLVTYILGNEVRETSLMYILQYVLVSCSAADRGGGATGAVCPGPPM